MEPWRIYKVCRGFGRFFKGIFKWSKLDLRKGLGFSSLKFQEFSFKQSGGELHLVKLLYFTNLDFPEIRNPISLPKRYLLGAQVVWGRDEISPDYMVGKESESRYFREDDIIYG